MASHLGYSEEIMAEIQKQEMYSNGMEGTDRRSSMRSRTQLFTCSLLSIISIVLIMFGICNDYNPFDAINHMVQINLKLLTDAEMPKPFYVIKNDVDHHKNVIQNAFYNFYFLKDVSIDYESTDNGDDVKYTVSFFDRVIKTIDGKETVLGYFSPVIPEGQPSNVFNFQYGDLCKKHKTGVRDEHNVGKLTLNCGLKQEITSIDETDLCTYSLIMTTPEMCSPKEAYSFLDENNIEVSDGIWWNYQINFFKKGHGSHIYKYHVGPGETSERLHLGSITDSLNADGSLQFTSGAVCKDELSGWKTLPREGHISVECGCEFGLKKINEISQCQYEITVTHSDACSSDEGIPSCSKLNLRSELLLKRGSGRSSHFKHKPSAQALGPYPRDLLHPKINENER